MRNLNKDRAELKRLVESYGKADVLKYVNHVDESRQDDLDAIQKCVSQISDLAGGLSEDVLAKIYQILEDFLDTVQNEPYDLGVKDGMKRGYEEYEETHRESYEEGYEQGYEEGKQDGYQRMYDKLKGRGFFGRMRNPKTLLTDEDDY